MFTKVPPIISEKIEERDKDPIQTQTEIVSTTITYGEFEPHFGPHI